MSSPEAQLHAVSRAYQAIVGQLIHELVRLGALPPQTAGSILRHGANNLKPGPASGETVDEVHAALIAMAQALAPPAED